MPRLSNVKFHADNKEQSSRHRAGWTFWVPTIMGQFYGHGSSERAMLWTFLETRGVTRIRNPGQKGPYKAQVLVRFNTESLSFVVVLQRTQGCLD